jgi:hypothetical protein
MNIRGSRITMCCTRTAELPRSSVPSLCSAAGELSRYDNEGLHHAGVSEMNTESSS